MILRYKNGSLFLSGYLRETDPLPIEYHFNPECDIPERDAKFLLEKYPEYFELSEANEIIEEASAGFASLPADEGALNKVINNHRRGRPRRVSDGTRP